MTLLRSLASLAVGAVLVAPALPARAQAGLFSHAEVDPANFVVVASPIGGGARHQLLILEQVKPVGKARACWAEETAVGTVGVTGVKPLLLDFDFTGICDRKTDSNGYSIRVAGVDLGLRYRLNMVRRNGDILLMGLPNGSGPELEIGRVGGLTPSFGKVVLNPGWRLGRRTFQGKPLGHLYLVTDSVPAGLAIVPVPQPVTTSTPPAPTTAVPATRPTSTAAPVPVRPTSLRPVTAPATNQRS